MHLRAEGGGKPVVAVLTGGKRHEQIALGALLDNGAICCPSRDRSRLRPQQVAGDQGYSSPTARRRLRRRHIRPVIPSKSNQRRQPHFDREAYRQRNRIDRLTRLILVMALPLYLAVSTGQWDALHHAPPAERRRPEQRPKNVLRSMMSLFTRGLRRIANLLQTF